MKCTLLILAYRMSKGKEKQLVYNMKKKHNSFVIFGEESDDPEKNITLKEHHHFEYVIQYDHRRRH